MTDRRAEIERLLRHAQDDLEQSLRESDRLRQESGLSEADNEQWQKTQARVSAILKRSRKLLESRDALR